MTATGVSVTVVGDETITCIFTDHKGIGLSVEAGFNYSGTGAFTVGGGDYARLTGDSDALAAVGKVCESSEWTVKEKLEVATSTPLFFNNDIRPFDSNRDSFVEIGHSPPKTIKGVGDLFKSQYTETMANRPPCPIGPFNFPLSLVAAGPEAMLSLSHRLTVTVYSRTGAVIGEVTTPSEDTAPGALLTLSKKKIQTFAL